MPCWARGLVWWAAAALLAGAVLPALSGPLVLDDPPALALARKMAATGDWMEAWRPGDDPGETLRGRPVTAWSFGLQAVAGATSPAALRAGNVVLHFGAGLLLAGVLREGLRRRGRPEREAAAAGVLAAAAWLVHPLSLSAVVYVVQRAEVLASLGMLAALRALLAAPGSRHPGRWLAVSALAAAAAGLAKESAAVAPLLLALHDRYLIAGSWRGLLRERRAYYLGLAAGWIPLAALVAGGAGRGGTAGWDSPVGVGAYLVTQGEAIAGYLWHVVCPHPLVFDHGPVLAAWADAWPACLVVLALLAAAVGAMARGHAAGLAGVSFFLCLAPSSSFVPVASQTIADHRMHLAVAAPLALCAAWAVRWAPRAGPPAAAAAILALALASASRHAAYRDEVALWTDTVAGRPDNPRAHHNLGRAVFARGDFAAAARHFTAAERLRPGDPDTRFNLALCALRLGRPAEARDGLERLLADAPRHAAATAALGEARAELGRAAVAAGRLAEARDHFAEAARLRPDDPRPAHNLGNVLLELDAVGPALVAWGRALAADPEFSEARRALALVLLRSGRAAEARPHLERLVARHPEQAELVDALAEARRASRR